MSAKGKDRLERIRRSVVRHQEEQTAQAATTPSDPMAGQARDDEYSLDMRQVQVLREKLEREERREERKAAVAKVIKGAVEKMGGGKVARMARRIGEAARDKGLVTSEEAPLLWNYRRGDGTREKLKKGKAGKKTEDERKKDDEKRKEKKRENEDKGEKCEEKEAEKEKKDEEKKRKKEEKSRKAEEARTRREMRQRVSLAQIYF